MTESPFAIHIEESFTDDGWVIRASVTFVDGCDRQALEKETFEALSDAVVRHTAKIRSSGGEISRLILDEGDGPRTFDLRSGIGLFEGEPLRCGIVTEGDRLRALMETFPDASEAELQGMLDRADERIRQKQRRVREEIAARLRKRLTRPKEEPQ
jgi:hypothetical protein